MTVRVATFERERVEVYIRAYLCWSTTQYVLYVLDTWTSPPTIAVLRIILQLNHVSILACHPSAIMFPRLICFCWLAFASCCTIAHGSFSPWPVTVTRQKESLETIVSTRSLGTKESIPYTSAPLSVSQQVTFTAGHVCRVFLVVFHLLSLQGTKTPSRHLSLSPSSFSYVGSYVLKRVEMTKNGNKF